MTAELTFAQLLARSHSIEGAEGFQYAQVWRFARDTDKLPVLGPPEGDGWVVNLDYENLGLEVSVPSWSDGSIVQQCTHWRREYKGMSRVRVDQTVHVQVRWEGDPKA